MKKDSSFVKTITDEYIPTRAGAFGLSADFIPGSLFPERLLGGLVEKGVFPPSFVDEMKKSSSAVWVGVRSESSPTARSDVALYERSASDTLGNSVAVRALEGDSRVRNYCSTGEFFRNALLVALNENSFSGSTPPGREKAVGLAISSALLVVESLLSGGAEFGKRETPVFVSLGACSKEHGAGEAFVAVKYNGESCETRISSDGELIVAEMKRGVGTERYSETVEFPNPANLLPKTFLETFAGVSVSAEPNMNGAEKHDGRERGSEEPGFEPEGVGEAVGFDGFSL